MPLRREAMDRVRLVVAKRGPDQSSACDRSWVLQSPALHFHSVPAGGPPRARMQSEAALHSFWSTSSSPHAVFA
jgi:hypothetical protein